MAFRLSQHTPLGEDLRRLADGELSGAIDRLRDLHAAPDPRVHAARKAIKRVRALLRLVRAGVPARRFRTHNLALRDAARELSAARDTAVALATFDRLVPADDPLSALRRGLTPHTTSNETTTPLHAAAEALSRLRPDLIADLDGIRLADLEAGLKDSYLGGREAMRAAHHIALPDDEVFHTWRKRAKDLWYQCQLLRDACPPLLGALEGMLDELGELLGEDHDLAVLQTAAPDSDALQRRIAARHLELRDAAWRSGQRIYAERPRAFVRRLRSYWQTWRAEP
ncbi:CHAD domain-containing protein [Nannocystis sp.]|uniref:CHAD domain-containing protein n=1 Tax=Nannocystis sp. TaxID=1962667 RepID=UPI002425FDCD|nr:CHAD domain-containing protein [Nannocystis sp.]MBK7828969.1 CHAD domain-containing protein [Nannocystis sp.]MBK9757637.1 CHAD domain-containing protein [Nannocystis sp.]